MLLNENIGKEIKRQAGMFSGLFTVVASAHRRVLNKKC